MTDIYEHAFKLAARTPRKGEVRVTLQEWQQLGERGQQILRGYLEAWELEEVEKWPVSGVVRTHSYSPSPRRASLVVPLGVVLACLIGYIAFFHTVVGDGITIVPKRTPNFQYSVVALDTIIDEWNALKGIDRLNEVGPPRYLIQKLESKGLLFREPLFREPTPSPSRLDPQSRWSPPIPPPPIIYMADYRRFREGMSYRDIVAIVGHPGTEVSRQTWDGSTSVIYQWSNGDGSSAVLTFDDDRLVGMGQFGLQ